MTDFGKLNKLCVKLLVKVCGKFKSDHVTCRYRHQPYSVYLFFNYSNVFTDFGRITAEKGSGQRRR